MKKVLFATTALVMTAGVAAADVALTGTGRMGLIYDGNDAQFSSRIRAIFTMTGESDGGLSFGGEIRADNSADGNKGTAGYVWISGTYGKLEMGDTVSASEAAVGDLPAVGYTEGGFAGDVEEIWYLTGDGANTNQGPNLLYTYTYENFSFLASASDGSDTNWFTTTGQGNDDGLDTLSDRNAWSLAAKYAVDNYSVGLGYAKHGDMEEIVLGGNATFNSFTFTGIYVDYSDRTQIALNNDNWGDGTEILFDSENVEMDKTFGLGVEWKQDAYRVAGFWRRDEFGLTDAGRAAGVVLDEDSYDSFGVGADYDLGGGAVVSGGIVDSDYLNDTVVDMGVRFKF